MGRGKHLFHKEKKIQVNVKLRESRLRALEEHNIISFYGSANQYINSLISLDLAKRQINEG